MVGERRGRRGGGGGGVGHKCIQKETTVNVSVITLNVHAVLMLILHGL